MTEIAARDDLVAQTREVILNLVDAIQATGLTQARTDVLLRAVETEIRIRRPGCDAYVKKAARSYISGLLTEGDLDTIRLRYSRPVEIRPVDLDAVIAQAPVHRPANPAYVRPQIVRQPAPQPYRPTQRPRVHPVSRPVRPRRHTNVLHYVVGALTAATVFGLGVTTIETVSPEVAAQGPWCATMFAPRADLDTSCIDDLR